MKPTYRKSWAENLLMWSDLTLSPSFKTSNLKVLITHLLLILEVSNLVKPTGRISWAGNLLMLLGLTFGPSFKVKQWFTVLYCIVYLYSLQYLHILQDSKYYPTAQVQPNSQVTNIPLTLR